MRIITDSGLPGKKLKKPVVTIGIFDGIHIGHKRLLRRVIEKAVRIKGTSVVVTFNPHPNTILDMIGAPPLLVSLKHRLNLIAAEGIDVACVLSFNKILAGYSAAEFIKKILIKKIRARAVIIGSDFKFGKDKKGDIDLLRSMGKKFGFSVESVPLFRVGSKPVSSTRIRALISSGRLKKASMLLGRPVSVLGTVIRGSRRGRILGFPTANINPHHEAIPPSGVYAVYATLNKKRYKGVLNIGFRPTFNQDRRPQTEDRPSSRGLYRDRGLGSEGRPAGAEPTIEVHLFGFHKNIYGKDIQIIFIKKLREERRFRSRETLVKQIRIDEHAADMLL